MSSTESQARWRTSALTSPASAAPLQYLDRFFSPMATFMNFTESQSNKGLLWVVLVEQMRGLTVPQLAAEEDRIEKYNYT